MNLLSLTSTKIESINTVYNTAFGESTTLIQLANYIKAFLSDYDAMIRDVEIKYAPVRKRDYTTLPCIY